MTDLFFESILKNMSEEDKLEAKELELNIKLNPSRYSPSRESEFGRRANAEVLEPFDGTLKNTRST